MKHQIMPRVGKTEAIILKYLAYNPDKLKKPISIAIKKDIHTVSDALDNLLTKGYLITRPTKSKKGVEYKGYRLSEKGIAFLLQLNNDIDVPKIFQNYGYKEFSETWKAWERTYGKHFTRRISKIAGLSFLATGKEAKLDDFPDHIATASLLTINQMPSEERQKIVEVINRDRKLRRYIDRVMRHLTQMK